MINDYERRISAEVESYKNQVNVHELPEIFHYWSNRYLKPMIEEFGFSNEDDFFAKFMFESTLRCKSSTPIFISIGSGNCDAEVRWAKLLKKKGLSDFCIESLDVNPHMFERGRELARQEGVSDNMVFIEGDFNKWKAQKKYSAVLANHSLHHVVNLEGLFEEIETSLNEGGLFIVHDMIGRNGHQRWPEALVEVHRFWQELPKGYRYNRQLNRHEELYENWDCSKEAFEGIRSQDILPLSIDKFYLLLFIGFANIIDVFIDRGFGHNFNVGNEWDCRFVDKVHAFDEEAICSGKIKPTHMLAVMSNRPTKKPLLSRGLSPEFCVRIPD